MEDDEHFDNDVFDDNFDNKDFDDNDEMKNLNLNTFSIKLFSALFEFWIVWLARGVLGRYFKSCDY